MICCKCHKPFRGDTDTSELYCICPDCKRAKLSRSLGRSASSYPHSVVVKLLDNRQLALRN